MSDPRGLAAARPFRFACQRCGNCCSGGSGFVWVDEDEIASMAQRLSMQPARFAERHLKRAVDPRSGAERWSLRERADAGGACSLLVGRNTCAVYEARPRHCREFPYWEHVLAGGAGFESARETCPGIAVVVPEETRRAACAALDERVGPLVEQAEAVRAEESGCCLDGAQADERWCSGLEADRAAAALQGGARAASGCRLGAERPLCCTLSSLDDPAVHEAARAAVRGVEREHGYPASYGPLRAQLRSRGVETDA